MNCFGAKLGFISRAFKIITCIRILFGSVGNILKVVLKGRGEFIDRENAYTVCRNVGSLIFMQMALGKLRCTDNVVMKPAVYISLTYFGGFLIYNLAVCVQVSLSRDTIFHHHQQP